MPFLINFKVRIFWNTKLLKYQLLHMVTVTERNISMLAFNVFINMLNKLVCLYHYNTYIINSLVVKHESAIYLTWINVNICIIMVSSIQTIIYITALDTRSFIECYYVNVKFFYSVRILLTLLLKQMDEIGF